MQQFPDPCPECSEHAHARTGQLQGRGACPAPPSRPFHACSHLAFPGWHGRYSQSGLAAFLAPSSEDCCLHNSHVPCCSQQRAPPLQDALAVPHPILCPTLTATPACSQGPLGFILPGSLGWCRRGRHTLWLFSRQPHGRPGCLALPAPPSLHRCLSSCHGDLLSVLAPWK